MEITHAIVDTELASNGYHSTTGHGDILNRLEYLYPLVLNNKLKTDELKSMPAVQKMLAIMHIEKCLERSPADALDNKFFDQLGYNPWFEHESWMDELSFPAKRDSKTYIGMRHLDTYLVDCIYNINANKKNQTKVDLTNAINQQSENIEKILTLSGIVENKFLITSIFKLLGQNSNFSIIDKNYNMFKPLFHTCINFEADNYSDFYKYLIDKNDIEKVTDIVEGIKYEHLLIKDLAHVYYDNIYSRKHSVKS